MKINLFYAWLRYIYLGSQIMTPPRIISRSAALALLAFFLFCSCANPVFAQSGYQTIDGTRVFTQVDQGRGVATFSNACGSQELTQRQLQGGAKPYDIIPCPRPGGGSAGSGSGNNQPRGRNVCGDGRQCGQDQLCTKEMTCLDRTNRRICSDWSYCSQDAVCFEGTCVSRADRRVCSNELVCPQGSFCSADNLCVSTSSPRVCPAKGICNAGFACTSDNLCIPQSSRRICSNNQICQQGTVCTADNLCVSETSPRVCAGNGVCEAGKICIKNNLCLSESSSRVCSGSKNYCDEGETCRENKCYSDKKNTPEPERTLKNADCKCASVVPSGTSRDTPNGSLKGYTVSNSCATLNMSVLFVDAMNSTRTNWARVGDVSIGSPQTVFAPAYELVSIKAVELRSGQSVFTCRF